MNIPRLGSVAQKNIDKTNPENTSDSKCLYKTCTSSDCRVAWHRPCQLTKNSTKGFVRKLKPMAHMIGTAEMIFGVAMLIIMALLTKSYDELYGTEESKVISLSTFYGLLALIVTGLILLIALLLNIRRMLWIYILLSSMLSVYAFALAVIKIHFALLVLERDTNQLKFDKTQYLLSTGCVFGILTLLGSVVHFMGNVTVFSYHNLKYIHPVLFDSPEM